MKGVNQHSVLDMPERFMSKLTKADSGCWLWNGSISNIGYGVFPYNGENKAHRVSYAYFVGDIPPGKKILHKCDVRNCVNPDHLFIGTQADNVADMMKKGRNKTTPKYADKNPMAKATWEIVADIRNGVESGIRQCDMAVKHGLSRMTVSRIVRKESWV